MTATQAKADELVERLERAVVTAQNDDLSEPLSEKRDRHVERQDATRDAIDTITTIRAQLTAAETRESLCREQFAKLTIRYDAAETRLVSARKALEEIDQLCFVIESAVRWSSPDRHPSVLAALKSVRSALSGTTGEKQ